jgi:hypothetical protein
MPLLLPAAEPPKAELSNGTLRVKPYPPDAANGFYRATRFDWSGMIESVEYGGHKFYGRWFQGTDPAVRDFEYRGADIIAGPNTAATGPAEEFNTNNKGLGFDEAKPGGTFLKIGSGCCAVPMTAITTTSVFTKSWILASGPAASHAIWRSSSRG